MELIADAITEIGYNIPHKNFLNNALQAGISSQDFRELLLWLTNEIHVLKPTEEKISSTDLKLFPIELAGFLNELRCPYEILTSGNIKDRFADEQSKTLLLDFLINELMTVRMILANKPEDNSNVITLIESPTASALKDILQTLNVGKPPADISPKALFTKIDTRINEVLKKAGPNRLGKPLFNPKTTVTKEQWDKLNNIHEEMDNEYDLRRNMLLTRLDCTVQAFRWSERMKTKENEIIDRYRVKQQQLEKLKKGGKDTDIPALLAARDQLLVLEKASSAAVVRNTKSKIQRYIIGQVPDRGGRAWEHAPPPPEMPSWQKNRATGGFGGRGGGPGGSGRGGGGRGGVGGNPRGGNQNQNFQGGGNRGQSRGGRSRIQGGWAQRGGQQDIHSSENNRDFDQSNFQEQGYNSRGGGRGRSQYNRGGRY